MQTTTLSRIEILKKTHQVIEGHKSLAAAMNEAHKIFKEKLSYSGPLIQTFVFSEDSRVVYLVRPKITAEHDSILSFGKEYDLYFIF